MTPRTFTAFFISLVAGMILLAVVLLNIGCTAGMQSMRTQSALIQQWTGQPVATVIQAWGPPRNSVPLGNGWFAASWYERELITGYWVERTAMVDAEGIVRSWSQRVPGQ